MDKNKIVVGIARALPEHLELPPEELDDCCLLGAGGLGMDSLGFLKFLTELEKEFQIQIDDDYWDMNRLKTVGEVICYIDEKVGNA